MKNWESVKSGAKGAPLAYSLSGGLTPPLSPQHVLMLFYNFELSRFLFLMGFEYLFRLFSPKTSQLSLSQMKTRAISQRVSEHSGPPPPFPLHQAFPVIPNSCICP